MSVWHLSTAALPSNHDVVQDFRRRYKLEPIVKDNMHEEEGRFDKQQRATVCESSCANAKTMTCRERLLRRLTRHCRLTKPARRVVIKGSSTTRCSSGLPTRARLFSTSAQTAGEHIELPMLTGIGPGVLFLSCQAASSLQLPCLRFLYRERTRQNN